ncbi:MAG: hypothetical protein ACP5MU_02750 [Thermoplasmata archaeon]
MSRQPKIENCKICGEEAKVYKWWTKDKKGKIYSYLKYYHKDGQVHYYRLAEERNGEGNINLYQNIYLFVKGKLGNKKLRFMELKREIESEYKFKMNNQTFWRVIKRMIRFNEIIRTEENGKIYYSKGMGIPYSGLYLVDEMYITFDLVNETLIFIMKVTNQSNKTETSIPITLPEGNVLSTDEIIKYSSSDIYGIINNERINVIFSYADETGLQISLNKPLKRYESDIVHFIFSLKDDLKYRRLLMMLDVSFASINVISKDKLDLVTRKISIDYSKESRPEIAILDKDSNGNYLYRHNYTNLKAKEMISIEYSEAK